MKLLHITSQFQYRERILDILRARGIDRFACYPRVHGQDRDGMHDGSQAFPGHVAVVHAQVPDESLDAVLEALRSFRDQKPAHAHVEAMVLPVERVL